MTRFHLFLSYARADNASGWVTAFHDRLTSPHARTSGQPLNVFFDKGAIRDGQDWERRIYSGLRDSRLFIAFLSPSYLESEWCRREWESYLRLEHSLARGDDGIKQIYFVTMPEIHGSRSEADPLPEHLADWIADLRRRNRSHAFDLRDWYAEGPQVLAEIDAAEPLAALRAQPRSDRDKALVSLADRVAEIDRSIATRLDKVALAELALQQGNIGRSYPHFVGRHRELTQLHDQLTAKRKIGVISALHGLGGQGKTALAEQYSYAYAEHYAAGGRWKLPCEGQTSLAAVLEPLVRGLDVPNDASPEDRVRLTLVALRGRAHANVARVTAELSALPGLHSAPGDRPTVEANTLLILDNVDRAELLSAREAAQLFAEDWLKVIVTTREAPESFGIDPESLAPIPVDDLAPEDALALIRDYRPLDDPAEQDAAREIVRRLGGFTLAVELVAAYLAANPGISVTGFLDRLGREGIAAADTLGRDSRTTRQLRYERDAQIGILVAQMAAQLSPAAREALAFASLLPPDQIVLGWLQALTAKVHPEILVAPRPGYPDPWTEIVTELLGRRLLLPAEKEEEAAAGARPVLVRLHRMVGEHLVRNMPLDACDAGVEQIVDVIHRFQAAFEAAWQDDPRWLQYLAPLESAVELLLIDQPDSRELAIAAGVAATAELETGSVTRGGKLLRASHDALERASEANPTDVRAQRDISVSLGLLGDFYYRRGQPGDAERALAAFEKSLDLAEHLVAANPDSAASARDVTVSLERLGDFYVHRGQAGDAERALAAFERSLRERERLLAANPGSAASARDVSVSRDRLGDFYVRRGDPGDEERALAAFEKSLEERERLLAANPGSAAAARDVSVSLNKLGDFYVRRGEPGDAEQALAAFEKSLQLAERLLAANPGSVVAVRDVTVSLINVGDYYFHRGQAGDAERALAAFERSLIERERPLAANPGSAASARDVSVSRDRLGVFYVRRGDPGDEERALAAFEKSLEERERLLAANPGSAAAARDVTVSLHKLGDFFVRRGQPRDAERARAAFEKSLQLAERLLAANPGSVVAARDVSVSNYYLARLSAQVGNQRGVQKHRSECFAILDGLYKAGRPMDPHMRQLHAELAGMVGRTERDAEASSELPVELVRLIFTNPAASDLLRKVMDDSGLKGRPEDVPFETQRAIATMLMKSGTIRFEEQADGEGS